MRIGTQIISTDHIVVILVLIALCVLVAGVGYTEAERFKTGNQNSGECDANH